jgi:putative endopeptidase
MRRLLLFLIAITLTASAQNEKPRTDLPYTPGLDVTAMDKTADPCVDFYQYSCGGWMKNNPIPPDQARWSVYDKLSRDNRQFLWGILDQISKQTSGRNANQQKIGDYYSACMDEGAVNQLGVKPLKPYLDQIAAMQSKKDLPALLARLQTSFPYPNAFYIYLNQSGGFFFNFGSGWDYENSQNKIAFAYAGGLGLPDRDYYTKTDEKSVQVRSQYLAHMERMFELFGDQPGFAKAEAAKVMQIETALAQASLTGTERRDPYKVAHKVDFSSLQAMTPHFDWSVYLKEMGLPAQNTFNVTQPAFYAELDRQLAKVGLDEIKIYLRWHTVHAAAPYLSGAFVNENFDFFSKTLRGVPQLSPRWERCATLVDTQLGEALGQEFVDRTFSPELKQKITLMATQIEHSMEEDINTLIWISPATKQQALQKLHTTVNKIGYPDKWRNYSSVQIKANDFLGNVQRASTFEWKRSLSEIGKPADRGEWLMTPQTVNGYANPRTNDINFPAAVLEPPLYDAKMDDAPNYGNTGGNIGHELTHLFDDRGRQFDAQGNLRDWWTEDDAKNFTDRAQCIVDQYAHYTVIDDIKINSKLTVGEDIADLGGLILAWTAWKDQTKSMILAPRDGLSPEQRFFVGYAQWTCENDRPEDLSSRAITDSHSPGRYRVNGLVVNMEEFQKAFICKAGQPMVSEKRCRVW